MITSPQTPEIDNRTLKLLIGIMALTLPLFTSALTNFEIASISESYHKGGWAQSVFIGYLFAIAAFLLAYNGFTVREMILSKCAAGAALGVALFPCKCGCHVEKIRYVHGISAAIMFAILAWFCWIFYRRAMAKGHTEAKRRAALYLVCLGAIVVAILLLAADGISGNWFSKEVWNLTLLGEWLGLIGFGVSWLVASKILPVVSGNNERLRFLALKP